VTLISLQEGSWDRKAGKRGCHRSQAVTPHQPRPTPDSWGLLISRPSASLFPHQMPTQAPLAAGTKEAWLLLLADNAIKKQIKRENTNWIHRSLQWPDREERESNIICSPQPASVQAACTHQPAAKEANGTTTPQAHVSGLKIRAQACGCAPQPKSEVAARFHPEGGTVRSSSASSHPPPAAGILCGSCWSLLPCGWGCGNAAFIPRQGQALSHPGQLNSPLPTLSYRNRSGGQAKQGPLSCLDLLLSGSPSPSWPSLKGRVSD